jgi:hypothetical protein
MSAKPHEHPLDTVQGCIEACRRCEMVVARVLDRNPEVFAAVGPHLRHCIDHFRLLLEGWPSGRVDYDARERDPRLERDSQSVLGALGAIVASLEAIGPADLSRPIVVTQSVAPGRPPQASPTCLERELAFLSGHTIHHIALMVLSARVAGVELPGELAVAYSTGAHRDALASAR